MVQHALALSPSETLTDSSFSTFPTTRYQGSKRKLLPFLHKALGAYEFSSAIDLYSGTCSVGLLLRRMGKRVVATDYLRYNALTGSLMLSLSNDSLRSVKLADIISKAFQQNDNSGTLVQDEFAGIYFTDEENAQVDTFCSNLAQFNPLERQLLIYLMGQSMLMKRPYNLFHRANLAMRTKDVPRSFGNAKTWAAPFSKHMLSLGAKLLKFDFDGPVGESICMNVCNIDTLEENPDLVYLDPPYLNKSNVAVNYGTFYHFLDGLVDYELFSQGNRKYPHKPIVQPESGWRTAGGGLAEVAAVLRKWPKSIIAISYRGDGQPSIGSLKALLLEHNYVLNDHTAIDYKYALSTNFDATEHLVIGKPASPPI